MKRRSFKGTAGLLFLGLSVSTAAFAHGKPELNAGANVAQKHKPILGFAFGVKGLFADVSLEGSKITRIETTA